MFTSVSGTNYFDVLKKIIILLAILVIPGVAYLFIKSGKNNYKTLEFFGPREPVEKVINGKTVIDTAYHTITNFSFTDQYNSTVNESIIENKIFVADYFFTTCKTICPLMTNQLMRVQYAFRDNPDVMFLSHTVDPEGDTPEVLNAYAKNHNAIKGKWYFLTGDKKALYDHARNSYYITALPGDGGPDDFIHSEQFVLVDRQKRIRGFYDGTDYNEVTRLINEIKLLKNEEQ